MLRAILAEDSIAQAQRKIFPREWVAQVARRLPTTLGLLPSQVEQEICGNLGLAGEPCTAHNPVLQLSLFRRACLYTQQMELFEVLKQDLQAAAGEAAAATVQLYGQAVPLPTAVDHLLEQLSPRLLQARGSDAPWRGPTPSSMNAVALLGAPLLDAVRASMDDAADTTTGIAAACELVGAASRGGRLLAVLLGVLCVLGHAGYVSLARRVKSGVHGRRTAALSAAILWSVEDGLETSLPILRQSGQAAIHNLRGLKGLLEQAGRADVLPDDFAAAIEDVAAAGDAEASAEALVSNNEVLATGVLSLIDSFVLPRLEPLLQHDVLQSGWEQLGLMLQQPFVQLAGVTGSQRLLLAAANVLRKATVGQDSAVVPLDDVAAPGEALSEAERLCRLVMGPCLPWKLVDVIAPGWGYVFAEPRCRERLPSALEEHLAELLGAEHLLREEATGKSPFERELLVMAATNEALSAVLDLLGTDKLPQEDQQKLAAMRASMAFRAQARSGPKVQEDLLPPRNSWQSLEALLVAPHGQPTLELVVPEQLEPGCAELFAPQP